MGNPWGGWGYSPESRPPEAFVRLDQSRNQNHSGVGLGMSIAEDIVRSHGGNIELNESKYKGLQIKISLPS